MRSTGWAMAFGIVLFAGVASADAAADEARAAGASVDAFVTARKLRKQWDQLRTTNATAATCVEDKVAQALALANRVDRRRVELKEAKDAKGRAVALAAIEALDTQRVELEQAALVCVHGKPLAMPKEGTRVTMQVDPKLPADSRERELQLLLMSLPMLGK